MQNTPKQDYTQALLTECVGKFPGSSINRIEADGRWWITYTSPSALQGVQACMGEQYKAHPYFDWIKARQASAQSSPGVVAPTLATAAWSGPVMAPIWHVGDEWEYTYKSPSDSGTYVWVVNRVEMFDGVEHYVVKSGTRELLYRVSDLASSLERVDGVIVNRNTPPRLNYAWPLTVGKVWDQDFRNELPLDRQTTTRNSTWTVAAEETVTVPAGTFRTLKITWRNRNTGALFYEMWYAPDVKQWVKIREVLSNGMRERELISFKLTSEPGTATGAHHPPQAGTVWGYTGVSGAVSNVRLFVYAPSKELCELELSKDRHDLEKENPWMQMAVSGCREALVVSGSDYWAFRFDATLSPLAAGASTRDLCEAFRQATKAKHSGSNPGECAPIAVRFLNQQ